MKKLKIFWVFLLIISLVFNSSFLPASFALEKREYGDIANHWAEKEIKELLDKNIIKGIEKNGVKQILPDKPVTRAEFLTLLLRVIYNENELNIQKGLNSEKTKFSDIVNHWAKDTIQIAERLKLIGGYSDGSFKPDSLISRAEIASMTLNASKTDTATIISETEFTDLSPSFWAYNSLQNMVALNLMSGYPDKTIRANNFATRAEAFVILNRLREMLNKNENIDISKEKDVPKGSLDKDDDLKSYEDNSYASNSTTNSNSSDSNVKSQYTIRIKHIDKPALIKMDDVIVKDQGSHLLFPETEDYIVVTYDEKNQYVAHPLIISRDMNLTALWIDKKDTRDTDEDGIPDNMERVFETDTNSSDSDNDGLSDYLEIGFLSYNPNNNDTDNDGILDKDEDYDDDGLTNEEELKYGTELIYTDSDSDGLKDKEEILTHNTNPLLNDTDGDGALDGWEVKNGFNPLEKDDTFSITSSSTKDNITASAEINISGQGAMSLVISPVNDNELLPSTMPGYMGSAFDFSVGEDFDEATISFAFDASSVDSDAEPTIYYFNEEEQELIALETTVIDGVASAKVNHFSKYILLNRKIFENSFSWQDNWDSSASFNKLDIALVIDDSGSMGSNDKYYQRLQVARELVDKLPENSRVGLIRFTSGIDVLTSSLSEDKDFIKEYLNSSNFHSSGGTRMYEAINSAFSLFNSTDDKTLQMMIVLSDGETSDTTLHTSVIEEAINKSIKIYTVGLGSSSGYFNNYLRPLAEKTGGVFYLANQASELTKIYEDINDKIDITIDTDRDGLPDYYEDNLIMFNGTKIKTEKDKSDSDDDGLKDGEEVILKYVYNPDKTKVKVFGRFLSNPTMFDTDGDGYDDKTDAEKLSWNVGSRDLAIFAALAYEDRDDKKMYTAYNLTGGKGKDKGELFYFYEGASLKENKPDYYISQNWEIVDFEESWRGVAQFSATTFKNGDNIVIAYRGTDGEFGEWVNNIFGTGLINFHVEEDAAKEYAINTAKKYPKSKIYITGHSLGGYLTQVGTYAMIEGTGINPASVEYFNGLGLKYNKLLFWAKNAEIRTLKNYAKSHNLISYEILGDIVSSIGIHSGKKEQYPVAREPREHHRKNYEETNFLWTGFSKTIMETISIASWEPLYYYYDYYKVKSFPEYIAITHETDSFYYYLNQGYRNASKIKEKD